MSIAFYSNPLCRNDPKQSCKLLHHRCPTKSFIESCIILNIPPSYSRCTEHKYSGACDGQPSEPWSIMRSAKRACLALAIREQDACHSPLVSPCARNKEARGFKGFCKACSECRSNRGTQSAQKIYKPDKPDKLNKPNITTNPSSTSAQAQQANKLKFSTSPQARRPLKLLPREAKKSGAHGSRARA